MTQGPAEVAPRATRDLEVAFDRFGVFEIVEPAIIGLVAGMGGVSQEAVGPLDNTLCFVNGACYINGPCLYPNALCHG